MAKRIGSLLNKPIVFAIALGIIFLIPWIISQTWLGSISPFGESSAHLGDTFGGLTSPFLGLLSSVLVYVAFKEQVRANEIQVEANLRLQLDSENENIRRSIETSFDKIEKYLDRFRCAGKEGDSSLYAFFHSLNGHVSKLVPIADRNQNILRLTDDDNAIIEEQLRYAENYSNQLRQFHLILKLANNHLEYLTAKGNIGNLDVNTKDFVTNSIDEFVIICLNRIIAVATSYIETVDKIRGIMPNQRGVLMKIYLLLKDLKEGAGQHTES